MRTFRKITQHPMMILLLLISFLNISCNQDDLISNNNGTNSEDQDNGLFAKNASFSDEEIFKGIMFLDGKIADYFPDFKELNFRNFISDEAKIKEVEHFQDIIINQIVSSNPNYLSEFRDDISSGDYFRVNNAIQNAANLLKEQSFILASVDNEEAESIINKYAYEFANENDINEETSIQDIAKAAKNIQSVAGDTVWFDTHTVVWAVAVVAGAVVAVGAVAIFLLVPDDSDTFNTYLKEKYFSDITIELEGI